jgi:hypothetical protein
MDMESLAARAAFAQRPQAQGERPVVSPKPLGYSAFSKFMTKPVLPRKVIHNDGPA